MAARTAADGMGARGWLEMGGEKKPLGMSELGCADGCGRRGCKGVAGNVWGEEAAGDERAWLRERLRTAWVQGWLEMGGEKMPLGMPVDAREWLEMGGEKKPLGMSELGCADGCGRQIGGEKKPLEISDQRACLRTAGAREWLEIGGEKKPLGMSELGCADGCGRRGCKGLLKFEKYSLPKFLSEIKFLSETLFFDIQSSFNLNRIL